MTTLTQLHDSLPTASVAFSADTMELRARATLSLFLDSAISLKNFPTPIKADPLTCPNCGIPMDSARSPYCSGRCREEAAFVRQFRTNLQDDALSVEEKQVSLGQNFWHLIGGGYPLRQSICPPSALKQLFKRTNNQCEVCGAPATTFDHTGSG
ncbi:MAG TPA: hypothetical protein VGL56_01505 [Fimbriimonadaceae bacterium]